MFYTYILISKNSGRYYIGATGDLKVRIFAHNHGKVRSTGSYKPWELFYFEEFFSMGQALRREKQIKKWKSRDAIRRLGEHFRILDKSRILDFVAPKGGDKIGKIRAKV
ncbi:MAG: hypothetical protein A2633_02975 [Candidatus Sungbacteria bacterium RIFCSPHIGHO2_01_FULL_47_32]|uniref:GIY-YIG domain-containing protein n=1 Tax=Candidatus Sungbacteria bacterium RIFCSPHIGHO2_01_FULL_47_32 TaxID=1802264 RepID=A0A1G2K788_9BACT|nr:MAG: Excinuclease abc c subunit domain protein [Parcubacteria group bacterium GW2011_GWA2_47_10]OGZ95314.1 MAG: hypothetical protein A2633_02975 [Candidatus Sungbacteria bacterium RIFCSPHIGHO2_01_FULL_47_32]